MTVVCRGVRGATTADANTKEAIVAATRELLEALVDANHLLPDQIAAAWLTTSPDLNAEFPAVSARQIGWEHVALLCGHEMNVPDAVKKCIRVMLLVNTDRKPEEINNVYLRGAKGLRERGVTGGPRP
ncbi:MAG: chorismate mutase [Dehalococcoidia bacterium]|nr:chorismate mutase [Dehalococcoidia bacterium]